MKVYQWREGARYSISPEVVGREIQRIKDQYGECTAEMLRDENGEPGKPLYEAFEWDDKVCGGLHRAQQARQMIHSIRIVEEDREPRVAFIHVKTDSVNGYVDSDTVAATPDLHRSAVAEALSSLRGWTRRYEHISGLAETVAAVNEAIDRAEAELAARPKRAEKPATAKRGRPRKLATAGA